MAQLKPWLSLNSFIGDGLNKPTRINLPDSFDLSVLAPFLTLTLEGWLLDLLGERMVSLRAWLNVKTTLPDESGLYGLVEPFLVYAVWASYIGENNVMATKTGLVSRTDDDEVSIGDQQRAELRRIYIELAGRCAGRITTFLAEPNHCHTPETVGTMIRIGKARGKTESRL